MSKGALTPKQAEIYAHIERVVRQTGDSPTLGELAVSFGVAVPVIREHVGKIEAKGWIGIDRYTKRGIWIVGRTCPRCHGAGHVWDSPAR